MNATTKMVYNQEVRMLLGNMLNDKKFDEVENIILNKDDDFYTTIDEMGETITTSLFYYIVDETFSKATPSEKTRALEIYEKLVLSLSEKAIEKTNTNGDNVLHLLAQDPRLGQTMIKLLKTNKVKPNNPAINKVNGINRTPLDEAMIRGNFDIVSILQGNGFITTK